MESKQISVTEAARNFSDCINRAHYQHMTFVLLKNGLPVARIIPDQERVCSGRDLAAALTKTNLTVKEAKTWRRDLQSARKILKAPTDRWK
jgi:antitoxin (DNA-binding transcriptional repressor) of toxin-antitoxin stability system